MEIKSGMRFVGNVNGKMIIIVKADEKSVTFENVVNGYRSTVGRKMFEHCDLRRVEETT